MFFHRSVAWSTNFISAWFISHKNSKKRNTFKSTFKLYWKYKKGNEKRRKKNSHFIGYQNRMLSNINKGCNWPDKIDTHFLCNMIYICYCLLLLTKAFNIMCKFVVFVVYFYDSYFHFIMVYIKTVLVNAIKYISKSTFLYQTNRVWIGECSQTWKWLCVNYRNIFQQFKMEKKNKKLPFSDMFEMPSDIFLLAWHTN